MVTAVDENNYDAFITSKEFAVLHFDAEWDVSHRPLTREAMGAAESELGSVVAFGEVDIDQSMALAGRIQLLNIPAVVYYRVGQVVAALIGAGQDVPNRVRRLMRGESIGYDDGTGTPYQRAER